jgi:hypothetical protein
MATTVIKRVENWLGSPVTLLDVRGEANQPTATERP